MKAARNSNMECRIRQLRSDGRRLVLLNFVRRAWTAESWKLDTLVNADNWREFIVNVDNWRSVL